MTSETAALFLDLQLAVAGNGKLVDGVQMPPEYYGVLTEIDGLKEDYVASARLVKQRRRLLLSALASRKRYYDMFNFAKRQKRRMVRRLAKRTTAAGRKQVCDEALADILNGPAGNGNDVNGPAGGGDGGGPAGGGGGEGGPADGGNDGGGLAGSVRAPEGPLALLVRLLGPALGDAPRPVRSCS